MGCYNTCVVNAPADQVWSTLRSFHDMSWAPQVITSLDQVGEVGADQSGAKRVLNGVFRETLKTLDDTNRTLTYSIDDGPDAVSKENVTGYIGKIRVLPVTDANASFVEWSSSWEDSKGGVEDFCNPIYKALLDSLKTHFA